MSSQEDEEPPRALNNMYDGSASDISETAQERFQRNKAEARRVWLSGFFCGRSYAPDPAEGEDDELSASAQEEALTEPTYVVPRGYKYRTSTVPAILAPIPTGMLRASYLIYAILATVAWVFLLISSTPIPWFHGKDKTVDGINFKNVKYTLWKRTGGDLPDLHVGDMDACPIQKHFFQTISVCMILGCVFTFFSVLAAVSRVRGGSTYGSALILGFVGFVWAIAGNSMSLSQYFGSACGAPRLSDSTSLDAGFALSLVAWIFLFAGLLLMAFATKLNVGPALKQIRVVDTYYFLLITVALLFTVVANAGTVWKRHFGTDLVKEVRVTYWHTELTMADDVPIRYGRRMYRCLAYTKRMKASISFLILSSIFLLFTALFAIPAFSRPPMRKVTCVFAIIAEIFLTISWVTAVVVFHMETCSVSTANTKFADYPGVPSGVYQGETKFTGYGLQEGVVLSIVAWILILVAVFINKYFP